jgi:hypothetical protein
LQTLVLSEATLEEIVQLLVKGGSKALDKKMYVKDFLMNLMTRESWNKNAKAGLDQIRDMLNPKKKKKNKQIQVDREFWNICLVIFYVHRSGFWSE